jgi:predicted secreted hydrolase
MMLSRSLGILLLTLLAAVGCVKSSEQRDVTTGAIPNPTATPATVSFPQDEQAHDSRLEWWYHSGHLESESGREFGFHFVLFKSDDGLSEPNLVAQLGLLDLETGKHYDLSRAETGFRSSGDSELSIEIANWVYSIEGRPGSHGFAVTTDEVSMKLSLTATSSVMLHNEIAWIPSETGASYYYSWPRQDAVGLLILDGEKIVLTGTGWFDHQWGDFFVLGKPSGWQWFAIQLDDGGSLMITEARGIDGNIADTYGTYMSTEGETKILKQESSGIELTATGEWTSPSTDATYPSGWTLRIDSLDLSLTLEPVIKNQEVRGGLPAVSTYWEGKIRASGHQNGEPITANAYAELSGYVDPGPIEWMQR